MIGFKAKDKGNTILPVNYEGIDSIAILDSGAGISIVTKTTWEKWGMPIVMHTCMNLQLADNSLENPIGLLENVTVTSCGIKYEHTFAIVDFGENANYEVVLGQPFMQQFRMAQEWGYNYLYLKHEISITRVKDCSNDENNLENLWMCGASKKSMVTDG